MNCWRVKVKEVHVVTYLVPATSAEGAIKKLKENREKVGFVVLIGKLFSRFDRFLNDELEAEEVEDLG